MRPLVCVCLCARLTCHCYYYRSRESIASGPRLSDRANRGGGEKVPVSWILCRVPPSTTSARRSVSRATQHPFGVRHKDGRPSRKSGRNLIYSIFVFFLRGKLLSRSDLCASFTGNARRPFHSLLRDVSDDSAPFWLLPYKPAVERTAGGISENNFCSPFETWKRDK